jgi:hypothetical protein
MVKGKSQSDYPSGVFSKVAKQLLFIVTEKTDLSEAAAAEIFYEGLSMLCCPETILFTGITFMF